MAESNIVVLYLDDFIELLEKVKVVEKAQEGDNG